MSEFIFEDREIPDLVLETVIGFLAEMTPMEKWGEIRSVSKRWNRISKPVFKEAFKRAWPKFVIPKNKELVETLGSQGNAHFNKYKHPAMRFEKDVIELTDSAPYRWGFLDPLPLRDVCNMWGKVSVDFLLATSDSVFCGVFLVNRRTTKLFDTEIRSSGSPTSTVKPGEEMCIVGAYRGAVITCSGEGKKYTDEEFDRPGHFDDFPVTVCYSRGGRVDFTLGGKPHSSGNLDEDTALRLHGENTALVFATAIGNKGVTVKILGGRWK